MRAFVVTGPHRGLVQQVPEPVAGPDEVLIEVERVGLCGTDVEFFTGEMQYLHDGHARYPIRLGHEWAGTVRAVGPGVDDGWLGRRVTGDTMLGCGRCPRCLDGRRHLCADRTEVGIRGGRPGALAEWLVMPAWSLFPLPDTVDAEAGAMVEPGGNAVRAVRGAGLRAGSRLLVVGPGTIGLLSAMLARAAGAQVDLLGVDDGSAGVARGLGFERVWTWQSVPAAGYDAVIDASNGASVPARALDLVEPGRRVVYIGLAGSPSLVDSRRIALADLTVVGVLSASGGLADAIDAYAHGAVDPRPLVAAVVGLDDVASVLAGGRPAGAGPGPKIQVDPRR